MAIIENFLKVDGIRGESKNARHLGEIELLSYETGDPSRSGNDGGERSFLDLRVTKYADVSGVDLVRACAEGRHIPKAVLTVHRKGELAFRFIMEDVIVASFNTSGSGSGKPFPSESVSFNYGKATSEFNTSKTK